MIFSSGTARHPAEADPAGRNAHFPGFAIHPQHLTLQAFDEPETTAPGRRSIMAFQSLRASS
jgi:hypothetical protein